ncbi:Maf family protein [Nocardioides sp.]|uniref:Maf family protein n=1 Tax=Nocardioides sp. TaxID=35761 RepID=UPI0039E50302
MTVLVLASQSPARLKTLREAGIEPVVIVSGVNEEQLAGLGPAELAAQLAVLKASAVARRGDLPAAALVLGCDSVLELDSPGFEQRALGKPGTAEEATSRWRSMRGRSGTLVTGHCLIDTATGEQVSEAAYTTVHFAELDDAEIDAYVATGEPLQVAGAFTIDGRGGAYVTGVDGDHHNVVGVSLPLLRDLVRRLGHQWHELWVRP